MKLIKVFSYSILLNFLFLTLSYSEILKEIKINGNVRITDEIISMLKILI
jgi:outer membrane protein insertion porin family